MEGRDIFTLYLYGPELARGRSKRQRVSLMLTFYLRENALNYLEEELCVVIWIVRIGAYRIYIYILLRRAARQRAPASRKG